MKVQAIIAAGGYGKRMGAALPKQLMELRGKSLIQWTLEPFLLSRSIDGITISAFGEAIPEIERILSEMGKGIPGWEKSEPVSEAVKRISIIKGGGERQESVMIGLSSLPSDTNIVIIHDAVRPFINSALIEKCISAAETYGAATVMRPVKETVKIVRDGFVVETIDRSSVWITQTPQAFRFGLIMDAHRTALKDGFKGTDDAMLVERMGKKVYVIEGSDTNIKITTKTDFIAAENIIKSTGVI